MRRPKVDLNQEFVPSTPSTEVQVHSFLPMTPFMLPNYHQAPKEDEEEERQYSGLMQRQKQSIEMFWSQQMSDIINISAFKSNHHLPLARIKRIMKSNGDVKMISADTPIVFSKACELFILELTLRAWLQTEQCKRRTLQRCDIARALRMDELLGFLVDRVPFNHHMDDESENPFEEIGLHPANQLHFPGIDISAVPELISDDHPEVPQQFMMKPSFSLSELNYGSTSE